MKRLLAILTLALAGAATTASAAYYYDYYEDNVTVTPTTSYQPEGPGWQPTYYTDTVTYKDFTIERTSPHNTPLGSSAHYKISITSKKVDLYLTDFIDNTGDDFDKNSIANMGVTYYGYRYLDADGNALSEDPTKIALPSNPDAIDTVVFTTSDEDGNPKDLAVVRKMYKLGTFTQGQVIELYMEDGQGGQAYSYSNIHNAFDVDPEGDAAQGGYGDGMKIVENTDKLLYNYYKNENKAAADKAMPLAALDTTITNRVYFGVYGQVSGAPLPGGAALYVIAGLFALGFIVFRRRKAMAS